MCWVLQKKGKPLSHTTSKKIFIYFIGICQPVGRNLLLFLKISVWEDLCFVYFIALLPPGGGSYNWEVLLWFLHSEDSFICGWASVFAALLWSELVQALSRLSWNLSSTNSNYPCKTNKPLICFCCRVKLPSPCSFLPSRSDFLLGCFHPLRCLKSAVESDDSICVHNTALF